MNKERNKSNTRPEPLSPGIIQKLQAIAEKHQVSFRKAKNEYSKIIIDPFIRIDPQFKTEAEREDYSLSLTNVMIMRQKHPIPKRLQKK